MATTNTTKRIDSLVPRVAVAPMEHVKEEMRARGMTQRELAQRMHMKESNLSRMLRQNEKITSSIAQRLEDALGIPASMWINYQIGYEQDLRDIAQRDEHERQAAAEENLLSSIYNLRLLWKNISVSLSASVSERIEAVKRLAGLTIEQLQTHPLMATAAYKRSEKLVTDERNLRTWALLAYIASRREAPAPYKGPGSAIAAAAEIARIAHSGNATEAAYKQALEAHGITYSVVPKLDKTPVDAYSAWAGCHPAIVTTHRYDDMSCLTFNILHELGHIALHITDGTTQAFIGGDGAYHTSDPQETEANRFAEDTLIPPATWRSIIKSAKAKDISARNIVIALREQAATRHLAPGIVIWRYRYETQNFALRGIKTDKIR